MPIVDTIGRIDEITSLVTTLEGRGNAASAARFETTLAAQPAAVAPVTTPAATATAGGVTGQAIVDQAKQYLGVPYVLGGTDRSGIDCSGLVQRVLGELGIEVPRRVSQQESVGEEVGSLAEAQPGDLIVTHNADHIVIYAGDGMIVHAPYEGRTVSYQPNYLTDADIQTIRRVVPSGSAVPPATSTDASVTAAAGPTPLGGGVDLAGALGGTNGLASLLGALTGTGTGSGSEASSRLVDLLLASQLLALTRSAL
ncbi:C40 family peptidase [Agromyces sp. NPDC056379]|uniref:C40 family peptidase n=1 Tax=unclassified Agromyces TaxID=2639701 RepID=UPI0035E225A2